MTDDCYASDPLDYDGEGDHEPYEDHDCILERDHSDYHECECGHTW